jgi:chorismate-pyruvate lyase
VAAVFVATSLAPVGAAAEGSQANYVQRLRLQAQLQTLNSDLLSHDSATAVLQALCNRRDPEAPPILAGRAEVPDDLAAANAARRQLGAAANEPVHHRRVELKCGEVVLSRADNWYLPGRLTAQMNTDLASTDRPFGVVIRPLGFQRRTLASRLLFNPLPPGWEAGDPAGFDVPVSVPANVLQHRAVLQTPDGRPFALLVETYSDRVLIP